MKTTYPSMNFSFTHLVGSPSCYCDCTSLSSIEVAASFYDKLWYETMDGFYACQHYSQRQLTPGNLSYSNVANESPFKSKS